MSDNEKNVILNDEEKELLLDHNYDGIEEFDFPLPSWWVATFYGGVIFAALYIFYYEGLGGPSLKDEYNKEWAKVSKIRAEEAAKLGNFNYEEYKAFIAKNEDKSLGETVFVDNCVACHKEKGIGDIGPNLTDAYWLNIKGKIDPTTLYPIVLNGMEDNGMPAWGDVLEKEEIYAVVDYLMQIKDTNLPGKEPQGEKIE